MITTTHELKARKASISHCATTLPHYRRKTEYSDEFYTPPEIPAALGKFDLDPAAGPMSHAVVNFKYPAVDGLSAEWHWHGRVWMNPPYSNIHEWLERFVAHGNGIALVNARPDAGWFQRLAAKASGALFIRGRITFRTPEKRGKHPPVGSVLFALGKRNARALKRSGLKGIFVEGPFLWS